MNLKRILVVLCLALFAAMSLQIILPAESQAVPSFARTMKTSCSTCHTNWPLLNEEGRKFLEQGFGTGELLNVDTMSIPKDLPVSVRLNLRLLDKRFSKDKTSSLESDDKVSKLRSLHEGEVFIAGKASDFSYFVEFEAEDEWPDPNGDAPGFQVQLAMGYAGWHPNPQFNVRAGFANPYGADGRNTVNQIKPHRYEWAASAKGFLPGDSQLVNVYGSMDSLFYSLALHGTEGDLEGEDPNDYSTRLAYDLADMGLSLGGFYTAANTVTKTTKYGVDAQWLNGPVQVNAIYAVNDVDEGDKDDVIGLLAQYIMSEGDSPKAAVGLNLDMYTRNDGDDEWTKGALFLSYFLRDNVKFQAGWEGTLDAPDAYENKESRVSLVADMGF